MKTTSENVTLSFLHEGGYFMVSFGATKSFPLQPPQVKFDTKIYHLNVNEEGKICIPVLVDEWQAYTVIQLKM